jgi:hypothetical protein
LGGPAGDGAEPGPHRQRQPLVGCWQGRQGGRTFCHRGAEERGSLCLDKQLHVIHFFMSVCLGLVNT